MPTIYHEFQIRGTIADVFAAVTEPEHLVNWWPLRCEGQPVMKAAYRFYFCERYDWHGEVASVVRNQSIHIKLTRADADWDPTTFGFELAEDGERVNVLFFHRDWREENRHFRVASFCWAMLLNGLKDYVESGVVIPFEQRS